jgi:hypothetical protein
VIVLALAAGCGVSERAELVGRYRAEGGGREEHWRLEADGTCEIARETHERKVGTVSCEWHWVERDGSRKLVITIRSGAATADAGVDQTRYVLTPSRFPGGPVTIPLGQGGAELRKVE